MITYNTILDIASEISDNKIIPKDGLTLEYKITPEHHEKLDEDLFYRINKGDDSEFNHTDIIEVVVGGILFKFIKDE